MARGKYKRKKQHNQQQAQQAEQGTVVMEQKEAGQHKAEPADKRTDKPRANNNPSRLQRIRDWFKRDKSFTDWCIALFTVVLSVAAIYQFIIMGGQLDVMRKDQRAWIAVSQKTGTLIQAGAAPVTTLAITDTGKTPALHMVAHAYVEIVPNGESPHFEAETLHTTVLIGAITPNVPQDVQVVRRRFKAGTTNTREDYPLTDDEWKALNDGKAWIAVHGIVWYDDVFSPRTHHRHWVKFCVWSDLKSGEYTAEKCSRYNDIDQD